MSLSPGTRVGPYEITAQIGIGGMGEVYRATDTNLGRPVAIKVLPDAFAQDAERLARFEREARTLASLNHPNIAIVHGLETSVSASGQATRALVMELVEGPTLADRIGTGPFPLDEALPIARQIAEALEAAHEQGIIHRDLKPANIKVRDDGMVKVLDFGLAKLIEPGSGIRPSTIAQGVPSKVEGRDSGSGRAGSTEQDPNYAFTQSPTITTPAVMTGVGMLLGTAAYMSPEQAKGRPADKRTDIWSFGCVFYEMLTGVRAFNGEETTDVLASVLKSEPAWEPVPPAAKRLIRKCLQKDPKHRLRDIGDAWDLLGEETDPGQRPQGAAHVWLSPRWIAWTAAAAAFIGMVSLAFIHFSERPAVSPLVQFQFTLAPGVLLRTLSVSPDGRHVAFITQDRNGEFALWVRSLDAPEARLLPNADPGGAGLPFWSPDSRFIGYPSAGRIWKIDTTGGRPELIADLPTSWRGGAWSQEGVIIFGAFANGLMKVPATGDTPIPLTVLDPSHGEQVHGQPSFLPDGRHFLYQRGSSSAEVAGIYVGSLDSAPEEQSTKRVLASDADGLAFAAADPTSTDGHILFRRQGSIFAAPFDASRLEVTGDPIPLVHEVPTTGVPPYSASKTGVLAYFTGAAAGGATRLVWYDRAGKALGQLGEQGLYTDVHISADGKKVSTTMLDAQVPGQNYVWTADVTRGIFSRLRADRFSNGGSVFAPDGRIAYSSLADGARGDIYSTVPSGGGSTELWVKSATLKIPNDFSPDGRFLAFEDQHPTQRKDLWIVSIGDRKLIPFVTTTADETMADFSPDGRWIAYSSDESGRREVYVRGFSAEPVASAVGERVTVSSAGGDKPRWSSDGKELYYLAPDGLLMAVSVRTGQAVDLGIPMPLFRVRVTGFSAYDVAPDGRFLMNVPIDDGPSSSVITIVLNWPELLRGR